MSLRSKGSDDSPNLKKKKERDILLGDGMTKYRKYNPVEADENVELNGRRGAKIAPLRVIN